MQTYRIVRTGQVREYSPLYTSPETVWENCKDMACLDREHFVVLHLDSRNRIIARETVSIGSLNQAEAHPREVFKGAIMNSSAAILIIHNHPSGDCWPGRADVEITRRLIRCGKLLGISVIDHIIIATEGYFSFMAFETTRISGRIAA